jgi:hypothetical protein
MQEFYMKLKICIILTILLAANFGYAQPKLITREELDKREVTEFTDEFMKSFNETTNFETMPSKFFSKKFKSNTVEANDFDDTSKQLKELSFDEQFEHGILIRSLFYLSCRHEINEESKAFSVDEHKKAESFPTAVLEILKKNRVLMKIFEIEVDDTTTEEDEEIASSDIVQAIELMRNAVALFKIYNENQELFSEREMEILSNFEESSYESELCGDSGQCFGMPKNTRIFLKTSFPLCLHLVRENGELRVFYTDFNLGD